MATEYKEISSWSYDPTTSIFKHEKSERGSFTILLCNSPDTCDEYRQGRCVMKEVKAFIGNHPCPCGRISRTQSPTLGAKSYREFFVKNEERHKDTLHVKLKASECISYIGNGYVYIPILYAGLLTTCAELKHIHTETGGGYFNASNLIISRTDFTANNIILMLRMKPISAFGGTITNYQKESVPKFAQQLKLLDRNLYAEVVNLMTEEEKSRLTDISNVGRTAVLETLNPNVGTFLDHHNAIWTWDGEWLHSTDSHTPSLLVDKFSELKLKPASGVTVKVTDDRQVNENTVFIN